MYWRPLPSESNVVMVSRPPLVPSVHVKPKALGSVPNDSTSNLKTNLWITLTTDAELFSEKLAKR